MASSEDDLMDTVADEVEDLFDDSDDAEPTKQLSDRELDSGDDEDRNDRGPKGDELDDHSGREARILDSVVSRHHLPKPFDGELNTLRMPKFLGIEPRAYEPQSFKIPTTDHHTEYKSTNFSASAVAASTIRYRKNHTSGKNESNAVVYRWSDGSTTIAIGDQHYELQSKPLAPPRDSKTYTEVQDSHLYLGSPSIGAQMLVVVGHMTNQYTVRPNKDIEDDALEKLQKSLAAATRGIHKSGDDKGGPELITNTEDPELQKRKAELAEKERNRLQRRRETAAEKANLPKHSLGGRGGLNVDDLEGRSGRRAPGAGRSQGPKPRRRRPDYDSDDDELPRGRNREDEYDKEDDFLASSDEELEEGGEDDDEEELLDDEDSEKEQPKSKRQKTSKANADLSDADADAEADLDDEEAPAVPASTEPAGRGRKRLIIEDDDDE